MKRGQFIDTYRGEIITSQEATKREEKATGKGKASYLYSLDKNELDENDESIDDCYVVDGEFLGGPTRFMNHSCDPNCGLYTVSLNKHDTRIYELAFFATTDIPANEELTFDYMEKEDDDEDEKNIKDEDVEDGIPCYCESTNCRRWLWR